MNPFVRYLLLILMVMSLPLQGMAAVTMGICAGEHHTAYVATSEPADHQHQHSHHQGAGADLGHNDHQHTSPDKQQNDKHKATCAACYAFSLPVSFTLIAPSLPATIHPAAPAVRFTGFEPEGLERPPRPFFA